MNLINVESLTLNLSVNVPEALIERLIGTILTSVNSLKEHMTITVQEAEAKFVSIGDTLARASTEIQNEIQKVRDDLAAAGKLTETGEAALNRIDSIAVALDNRNPDAPNEPPNPEVPPVVA